MKLLLDTHILLWFVVDNHRKLRKKEIEVIKNIDNNCFISIASFWEISIKYALHRLDLKGNLDGFYDRCLDTGFELLPVSPADLVTLSTLPSPHSDPFDRLLIAQAITHNFQLVSRDSVFEKYDVALF